MNRDGYKFDINVRRNGFMSYLWSAEVEDEGFFTPIANGTAHSQRRQESRYETSEKVGATPARPPQ